MQCQRSIHYVAFLCLMEIQRCDDFLFSFLTLVFIFFFRYKESISKSTRGWKERLFARNTSMADLGSDVKREVNAGIATVSRMMERLETRDNSRTSVASVSNNLDSSDAEPDNQQISETGGDKTLDNANIQASCAAGSSSN